MQAISKAEARRLIKGGHAGYFALDGVGIMRHPEQTAVRTQGHYFLAAVEEFKMSAAADNYDAIHLGLARLLMEEGELFSLTLGELLERKKQGVPSAETGSVLDLPDVPFMPVRNWLFGQGERLQTADVKAGYQPKLSAQPLRKEPRSAAQRNGRQERV